ncbi:uncharacterized protein [Temnothorax longispinosus]|uniref:uncharacterized protein n=1 Tax=Temnothorax longispinosus TaxID=300112 RepID=UPI003A9A1965
MKAKKLCTENSTKAKSSANSKPEITTSAETSPEIINTSSSSRVSRNQPSLDENLSALMRNLKNIIYLYGNGDVINFLNHILHGVLNDCNTKLTDIPPFVKALYETCKSLHNTKVERMEAPPFNIELPSTYLIDGPDKVPLFQGGRFYVLPQQLALISSKTKRTNDWKSYVKAVIHELYGNSAAWISACGTRNTVGIHPQLFDDLYEEICKRTKILVKKSDYIYQVNHLASNKRRARNDKQITRRSHEHNSKKATSIAKSGPGCSTNDLSPTSTSQQQNSSITRRSHEHNIKKATSTAKSDLRCNTSDLPSASISELQNSPIEQLSAPHNTTLEPVFQHFSSTPQPPPTLSPPSASFEKNFGSISSPEHTQESRFSSRNQNNQQTLSNYSNFHTQPLLLPHHSSSFVPFSNPSEPSQIFDNPQFKNFMAQCFMQFTQQSTPPKHDSIVSHSLSFPNNLEQPSFMSISQLSNSNESNTIEKDQRSYHVM